MRNEWNLGRVDAVETDEDSNVRLLCLFQFVHQVFMVNVYFQLVLLSDQLTISFNFRDKQLNLSSIIHDPGCTHRTVTRVDQMSLFIN